MKATFNFLTGAAVVCLAVGASVIVGVGFGVVFIIAARSMGWQI